MAHLLTNHDPNHIHAICGFAALVHWLYRFYLLFLDVPDAGFGKNAIQDTLCMILMILPNVTSFVFTIVPIKKGIDGFTIWREYRWHAAIFAGKMWFLQALLLFVKYNYPEGLKHEIYIRAAIEFGTMTAAQYVTSLYPKQESTIRGMYKQGWSVFLAGFIQFLGRAAVFTGPPDHRDDMAFSIVAVFFIQLNAFNMTLRKKRITGPRTTQALYSGMLISAFYMVAARRFWAAPPTGFFEPRVKLFYLAGLAYYARRQGVDRFSSWIVALSAVAIATQQFGVFQGEEAQAMTV